MDISELFVLAKELTEDLDSKQRTKLKMLLEIKEDKTKLGNELIDIDEIKYESLIEEKILDSCEFKREHVYGTVVLKECLINYIGLKNGVVIQHDKKIYKVAYCLNNSNNHLDNGYESTHCFKRIAERYYTNLISSVNSKSSETLIQKIVKDYEKKNKKERKEIGILYNQCSS